MPYEEAHVDGSVERIEEQVQVDIAAQFAAQNPATQCSVCLLPARPEEAFAESGDEVAVALAAAQDGGNNASTRAAKNFDELTHLLAHVRTNEAGIREVEFTGGAAGECVGDEHGFVWPPAINSCLAHVRMSRDGLDGQGGKAILSQKFQSAAQDSQAGVFTAWAARETPAIAPTALAMNWKLLAHVSTLPYNN